MSDIKTFLNESTPTKVDKNEAELVLDVSMSALENKYGIYFKEVNDNIKNQILNV